MRVSACAYIVPALVFCAIAGLAPALVRAQREPGHMGPGGHDRTELDQNMGPGGHERMAREAARIDRARTALADCRRGEAYRCRQASAQERRPARRRMLLVRACRGDDMLACEILGTEDLSAGRRARGRRWLALACRGGNEPACMTLRGE